MPIQQFFSYIMVEFWTFPIRFIFNLVCIRHFWNTLHQVCSKSKRLEHQNVFRSKKTKRSINIVAKIVHLKKLSTTETPRIYTLFLNSLQKNRFFFLDVNWHIYPALVLFEQSNCIDLTNVCYIQIVTEIFLYPFHMFYLLSFGKLVVNQFTSSLQKISKGAIKG
jgi:hypothetical protein